MEYEKNVKDAVEVFGREWIIFVISTLVVGALGCLTLGLLMGPLVAGLGAMFLKAKKGEKPVFNDLFQFNGKFIGMAVMGLLVGLGVMLGTILLILPGLLLATMWMYSLYAMAYDGKGISESMKASWEMVKKAGVWQQLVVLLAIGLFNSIGAAFFGIGTLVTLPLSIGFLAISYGQLK
jgi:hypothetical protein